MSSICCSLCGVSVIRAKSSAYIGDPMKVSPIDTSELRSERDSSVLAKPGMHATYTYVRTYGHKAA